MVEKKEITVRNKKELIEALLNLPEITSKDYIVLEGCMYDEIVISFDLETGALSLDGIYTNYN